MAYLIFNEAGAFIARLVIGFLFLFSGITKLPDLKGFFAVVVQYKILKGTIAKAFAYSLPFAELITGAAIMAEWEMQIFSGLGLLMLIISTMGVGYALYKKQDMENCGCYGTAIKVPISKKKLAENVGWIAVAAYLFVFHWFI